MWRGERAWRLEADRLPRQTARRSELSLRCALSAVTEAESGYGPVLCILPKRGISHRDTTGQPVSHSDDSKDMNVTVRRIQLSNRP